MSDTMTDFVNVVKSYDQFLTPSSVLQTVDTLADTAAVTSGEVRLFLCLIAAYPLAYIWRGLPNATSRHVFSVLVGGWMLQFVNGYQAILNLGSVMLCYFIMHICESRCAVPVSVAAMGMLAGGHIYRQVTDYLGWTLDWTLVAMVTTQKVMGLAYNIQDGQDENATDEQKARSVDRVPSILEFLSFILFPGNVIIGPAFEYADYMAFAEGTLTSPNPFFPGIWKLFQGLFYFAAHTAINSKFPAGTLLTSAKFFTTGTWLYRYAVIWVALVGVRFKYYFGWKIAEGAACMAGLGYNGIDKTTARHKWNRVENIDVLNYETSKSLRTSSQCWNKTTNLWLRRYVYDRAPPSVNLYFTYLVSAFWHGFYPGYYMFFLSVAAATNVHRQVHRKIRPRFLAEDRKTPGPYLWVYDVVSAICTSITLNYFIISFVTLAYEHAIFAFRGFDFFGHYALLVALLIFNSPLIKAPPRTPKPEKKSQ